MELKLIQKNNETILLVTFYGGRREDVLSHQKKVFDFFGIQNNYVKWPFHQSGHGDAIQYLINALLPQQFPDYFIFIDSDAIPLRKDFVDVIYDKICDKNTVFGPAMATNHRGYKDHVYAAAFCLAFSKKLYLDLGRPLMTDTIERSDNSQELTWKAQEAGKNVCYIYPKSFNELTPEEMAKTGNPKYFNLGKYFKYGLGTQYGDLIFHAFMQDVERGSELFMDKCREIIGENKSVEKAERKLEAVIVCAHYSRFLEITLPLNKDKFDNIIVITAPTDFSTQEICKKHGIDFVATHRFYDGGNIFDKGGAINEGLKRLKYNSFVCHLDCDIVLPDDFREKVQLENLDINTLYGCRRYFVDTYQDWLDFKSGNKKKEDFTGLQWGGWGCGYIQIWNMRSPKIQNLNINYLYPSYPTAAESDILMLKRFHPDVREVGKLDVDVFHLGNSGVNHNGKDNKTFFGD